MHGDSFSGAGAVHVEIPRGLGGQLRRGKHGDPAPGGGLLLSWMMHCGREQAALRTAGGMCRALAETEPTVDLRAMPIPVSFPVVPHAC